MGVSCTRECRRFVIQAEICGSFCDLDIRKERFLIDRSLKTRRRSDPNGMESMVSNIICWREIEAKLREIQGNVMPYRIVIDHEEQ